MASKKYSLLAGVLCLLASGGYAQTTGTTGRAATAYDVADSSVVPSRRMPQHTEFMNGTYNYPAKPRNMWEIGVKTGLVTIGGDVDSKLAFPSFGVHIRKALGYVFSLRLEYMYGTAKGQNWQSSGGYRAGGPQNPLVAAGYSAQPDPRVFYNFKTTIHDLALEGVVSLNNIRFHKSKTSLNFYGFGGFGATIYDVMTNIKNGNANYNFATALGTPQIYTNRSTIKDQQQLDDSYETQAENHGLRRPRLFGWQFRPVAHIGAGVAFRLSNRINLALEDRFTITKDDLFDGVRWAEQGDLTRDFDTYNFLSLGLNFNIGSKSVEPLWWVNPLDYAYSEIRKPRLMQLPKPVLPDSDGDGVTDQFDMEQTPQGAPVDTHGVSLDTDGDGVPDYRDKEKNTPTTYQPVDADGVGKAPCPDTACLRAMGFVPGGAQGACATALGTLPSVTFSGNGVALSNDARGLLASVAARLRQNPECKVVVTGYCASSKTEQQRSWDRVNAVINYMVEREGISADRFYFNYGQEGGDCNTIDLRAANADEQGQTTVPAPHPNLRRN